MIFFDGRRIFTHVEKKLIFKIGFVTSSSDFFNIGADSFLSKSEQRKEESERVNKGLRKRIGCRRPSGKNQPECCGKVKP